MGWFVLWIFVVGLSSIIGIGISIDATKFVDEFADKLIADMKRIFEEEMTCEDLKPHIIKMTQEDQNPFAAKILKFYNIQKSEQKEANQVLACTGEAKTSRGENSNIKFHLEKDSDGDYFYGYEWQ